MITGLIIGAVLGGGILTAFGLWYTRQQQIEQEIENEEEEEKTLQKTLLLDLPVEKKLRNALFECERGENKCKEEIYRIIDHQFDLLEGIGKASYVELKDKPAFFIVHNPITNEKRYYYNRDLKAGIDAAILTDTQRLLFLYNEHIDLFVAKIELFKKLQQSHKENLDRINGIHQQNEQLLKLKKHKGKIAELEGRTDIEVNALKNEAMLEDIERELEFQSQCLQQYSELSEQYDQPFDKQLDKDFKMKIQNIINRLEEEDPEKKD